MNLPFYKILLEYTTIDKDFIKNFFKKFNIGDELEFNIKDKKVAKYLNIEIITLRQRLNNYYSKYENYMENVDYIKIKNKKYNSSITYMLNYPCFEKLAMNSDSDNSESVRIYFSELRRFIYDNQTIIYQSMINKDDLKKLEGYQVIYFFAIDDKYKDLYKVGRSMNILQRLRNYNVGRINEVDLKFLCVVKNNVLIENCVKNNLLDNVVIKKKEIYQIEPKKLKKIIYKCYCDNISKEEHENLFEELGDLLKYYKYIKNKKEIKPYIIINK